MGIIKYHRVSSNYWNGTRIYEILFFEQSVIRFGGVKVFLVRILCVQGGKSRNKNGIDIYICSLIFVFFFKY